MSPADPSNHRRFIDRFQTILFDVCNTLMFGYDRYGPEEDYYPEYTALGGNTLDAQVLAEIINQMHRDILAAESVTANYDPFPSMSDFLLQVNSANSLSAGERAAIEAVFARHECGTISTQAALAVRRVHETHPVGIISNIWSHPAPFEAELRRVGIRDLLHPRVWSADYGCLKPSPRLFQAALAQLDAPPEHVLYVGDHFLRDVVGAKEVGMSVAWVNAAGAPVPAEHGVTPDLVIRSVSDLLID